MAGYVQSRAFLPQVPLRYGRSRGPCRTGRQQGGRVLKGLMLWLVRAAAWAALSLIAVLSLLPAQQVVRTGASGYLEHVFAYAVAAALTGFGYAGFSLRRIAVGIIAYAGLLEILQSWSLGRQAEFAGWAASSSGVLLGSLALYLCLTQAGRLKTSCT